MKVNRKKIEKILLVVCFIGCMIGIPVWSVEIKAADSYPFEKYYNPDEDEWANVERVTMDGELDFTVPDMAIESMDLIVYGTNDPKIESLENEEEESVEFKKKYGDDSTYTYYTVSDVTKGDWELQLRGDDWESTRVYLIYYSAYTSKYTIEKELEDPDSGNYQILIRLYDENDEILTLKNRKVQYLIDDRSLMSETTQDTIYDCYLGLPGLNEDDMDLLGNDYSCHIITTSENGDIVLTESERADSKEFKEMINDYNPSILERFQAKSAQERKTILIIAGSLILFFILMIIILRKTNLLGKKKEKEIRNKEERYQQAVLEQRRMQESWQNYRKTREQIGKVLEQLEPYEVWIESILSDKKRRNYEKLMSGELFEILKQCVDRASDVMSHWDELRQTKRRIPENTEKEFSKSVSDREQLLEEISKKLDGYHATLCQLKDDIFEFQDKRMFHDISVCMMSGRSRYTGLIEAQELGMPRKKGIQILNYVILRGDRKVVMEDLDFEGLTLAVGFTEDDKRQEMILISNRELFSEEEEMEALRKPGKSFFGPYQYIQFEGLELYIEGRKEIRFRINSDR